MIVWMAIGLCLAVLVALAPLRWAAAITIFCIPFSGTAVLMLGSDPVLLPLAVMVGFLARHAFTMLIGPLRGQFLMLLRGDWLVLAFLTYCIIAGLNFPKLFANATIITPQTDMPPTPLGAWAVSYVQMAYLACAVYGYFALRQTILRVGVEPLLYAILAQIVFIGGFGFLQAIVGLGGVTIPTQWIVSNSGYVLHLSSFEQGFVRVTSVFVESSAFATWGAGAIAFCYALYVNRIFPLTSLIMAACMAVAMLLSTSSTAYAGLAGVAVFAGLHALLDPDKRRRDRGLLIVLVGVFFLVAAALVIFSAEGGFLGKLRTMIENMTVNKAGSASAVERGSWAARSIQNAFDTMMLGVGYGAARSSGILTSLFGMVGLPGLLLFLIVFGRLVLRAFQRVLTGEHAVSSAAGFGLFGSLAAMAVSAPDLNLANAIWCYAPLAAAPLVGRAALRAHARAGMAHGEPA